MFFIRKILKRDDGETVVGLLTKRGGFLVGFRASAQARSWKTLAGAQKTFERLANTFILEEGTVTELVEAPHGHGALKLDDQSVIIHGSFIADILLDLRVKKAAVLMRQREANLSPEMRHKAVEELKRLFFERAAEVDPELADALILQQDIELELIHAEHDIERHIFEGMNQMEF